METSVRFQRDSTYISWIKALWKFAFSKDAHLLLWRVVVCCCVLFSYVVSCGVLWCAVAYCGVLWWAEVFSDMFLCLLGCCAGTLLCVFVCCGVVQNVVGLCKVKSLVLTMIQRCVGCWWYWSGWRMLVEACAVSDVLRWIITQSVYKISWGTNRSYLFEN